MMTRDDLRDALSEMRLRLLQQEVVDKASAEGRANDLDNACEDLAHAIQRIDIANLQTIQQRLAGNEAALTASTKALKDNLKQVENIGKILNGVAQVIGIVGKVLA